MSLAREGEDSLGPALGQSPLLLPTEEISSSSCREALSVPGGMERSREDGTRGAISGPFHVPERASDPGPTARSDGFLGEGIGCRATKRRTRRSRGSMSVDLQARHVRVSERRRDVMGARSGRPPSRKEGSRRGFHAIFIHPHLATDESEESQAARPRSRDFGLARMLGGSTPLRNLERISCS